MVAMVKKPALFAFSAARLHQWKVLGIVYKNQALKLIIIKKDHDFDFFSFESSLTSIGDDEKLLKLSIIGQSDK